MRLGYVYYKDTLCGEIIEDGNYIFRYYDDYLKREDAKAISLTMPLKSDAYESNILHPFFDGLIPEGYLLEMGSKIYNISKLDRMGLLLKLCGDAIGAVSVSEVRR